jgi:hypothetical protein
LNCCDEYVCAPTPAGAEFPDLSGSECIWPWHGVTVKENLGRKTPETGCDFLSGSGFNFDVAGDATED